MDTGIVNLRLEHAPSIQKWEMSQLMASGMDEIQAQMESWKSSWRSEALEYYLEKGWCFGVLNEQGQVIAYCLGNVLPFFRGYTQVLWIETLRGDSEQRSRLFEVVYGYAKEKHLQMILTENLALSDAEKQNYKQVILQSQWSQFSTAKNRD